ncbi:hypothetical protein HDV05_003335 [Chytridiales sp. JEL 0842]|nr:hypothetical protein HDV05_003335 [Chytridiales sp. JEL 0842]
MHPQQLNYIITLNPPALSNLPTIHLDPTNSEPFQSLPGHAKQEGVPKALVKAMGRLNGIPKDVSPSIGFGRNRAGDVTSSEEIGFDESDREGGSSLDTEHPDNKDQGQSDDEQSNNSFRVFELGRRTHSGFRSFPKLSRSQLQFKFSNANGFIEVKFMGSNPSYLCRRNDYLREGEEGGKVEMGRNYEYKLADGDAVWLLDFPELKYTVRVEESKSTDSTNDIPPSATVQRASSPDLFEISAGAVRARQECQQSDNEEGPRTPKLELSKKRGSEELETTVKKRMVSGDFLMIDADKEPAETQMDFDSPIEEASDQVLNLGKASNSHGADQMPSGSFKSAATIESKTSTSAPKKTIRLAIPSIATNECKIPTHIAADCFRDALQTFLDQAAIPSSNPYEIVLIDPSLDTISAYTDVIYNVPIFKTHQASNLGRLRSEEGLDCQVLVVETNWRMKWESMGTSRAVYERGGNVLKDLGRGTLQLADSAMVAVPTSSPLYTEEGVTHIIHVHPPNLNPNRPDPLPTPEATVPILRATWEGVLRAFRGVVMGSPATKAPTRVGGGLSYAVQTMMQASARQSSSSSTPSKTSTLSYASIASNSKQNQTLQKIPSNTATRGFGPGAGGGSWDTALIRHASLNFRFGFHAVPSMKQLHLHVISDDMVSPCMKKIHHWNSFTTRFFLPFEDVRQRLFEEGRIEINKSEYEMLLKAPLVCNKCQRQLANIPTLKSHLEDHLEGKL